MPHLYEYDKMGQFIDVILGVDIVQRWVIAESDFVPCIWFGCFDLALFYCRLPDMY